jgi:choline kinase
MKAIIVAAGPSNRLLPITNEKPKCLHPDVRAVVKATHQLVLVYT